MADGYQQHFKKVKANAPKRPINPPPAKVTVATKRAQKEQAESAEDYLREALRVKKAVRRSSTFPALLAGVAALGLGVGCVGYFYPSVFSGWISRIQVRAMSLAEAASDAVGDKSSATNGAKPAGANATAGADSAAKSADPAKPGDPKSAETQPEAGKTACVEKKGFTDEELSHFNKLSERKKELDLREAELTSLEEELHKQKKEVETRIAKLEQIREEVANVLKDRVEVDQVRVNTLVEFYSNMKPKQAADVFGKLNEDLAVEVLGKMKKKNAAEILNLLDPTKARVLSEKFTGYKRD